MAPTAVRPRRAVITALCLVIALIATALFSASVGQFEVSLGEVARSVLRAFSGQPDASVARIDAALWTVRFPRTVLSLLAGAALAVGGTVMQAVFANPLAEPSIIGVSSGASVGATLAIVLGLGGISPWLLPSAAFVGALVVTLAVWAFARITGRASVVTLILTGIAINAVASAVTSFLIFLGDTSSREQVIFWQLGSVSGANWSAVAVTATILAIGLLGCLGMRHHIDVLALGDASAASSGVNVERIRITAIIAVCLLTGIAVAFCGVIGFIGLIVPHGLRLIVGPSARFLIPLSALAGALLLGLADIAARTAIPFADLPIGIFTAVVGGPLFLVLLRRTMAQRMGA